MNQNNGLTIPEHLQMIVEQQIQKAKYLQDPNTMSFIFFTDSHFVRSSSFIEIDVLNYINAKMKVEFAVCCGDTLGNEATKALQMESAATLMKKVTMDNFFVIKGNHDDNSIQSEDVANIQSTLLPPEYYEVMLKRLEGKVRFDSSNQYGLYYYYDFPEYKLRSIFLNSIDIPYIAHIKRPTAWKYAGQSTYAYSDAQLNWLANTALRLPSRQWNVMLFTHINPFPEGMIGADAQGYNDQILLAILEAFKAGEDYQSKPSAGDFAQSVSVKFSKQGPGKIIAFFYGHTHSEQFFDRNGIQYISTWNDSPYQSASNPNAPSRVAGTLSEFCLNVITIDFLQSKLFMTKFGVGSDAEIKLHL
jgi:predicted phosphodiesterase